MKREKFLPIGSVCLLKGAKKRVMITGFLATGKETGNKTFDYMGCIFPEGILSSEQNLLFDHEQIDKIFYLGYSDDEQKALSIRLKELDNKNEPNDGEISEISTSNNSNLL